MKKQYGIIFTAVLIGLLASGLSFGEAAAKGAWTPKESCMMEIEYLKDVGANKGSFFDAKTERCFIRYDFGSGEKVRTQSHNFCYPMFDVHQAVWGNPLNIFQDNQTKFYSGFYWVYLGCMEFTDNVIRDPLRGSQKTGGGSDFSYEANTCDGGCRVDQYTLTGPAKNALSALDGKVVGKTFVQIKDKNGNLDYGDFTLCLQSMGAKNPAFFRYGGGNSWSYMGGYLKGSKVCMAGTMSGNYVLVDMGK